MEGDRRGKIIEGTEANIIVGGQVKGENGINEGQDRTEGK